MNLKKLVIAPHELNQSGVCYILAYSSRSSRSNYYTQHALCTDSKDLVKRRRKLNTDLN